MLLNRERLKALMAGSAFDAVVATTPENVTYMSGFWAMTQWIRRGPQAYVLWPAREEDATIITHTATLDLVADQQPWVRRVRRYGAFHVEAAPQGWAGPAGDCQARLHALPDDGDAISALAAAIEDAGLGRARIGIDEFGLLPGYLERIRERLPNVKWHPAGALLRQARAVKTAGEIERLRGAARIAEASIEAALSVAAEGASERALARAFHVTTVKADAEPVLGCIGFGERSALMNVQPSERTLRPGDVIRFDVGGRYRHYRADIARIASFGEPSREARQYLKALIAGVEEACARIRPGVRAAEVFEAAVAAVQRAGIRHYRRNHVGHGIGLDGYDAPSLSPDSGEVLEEGMVLCVETPYYELGRWGLQVEDMVVVRADGVERLSTSDAGLRVVPS